MRGFDSVSQPPGNVSVRGDEGTLPRGARWMGGGMGVEGASRSQSVSGRRDGRVCASLGLRARAGVVGEESGKTKSQREKAD